MAGKKPDREWVETLLDKVGLSDRRHHRPAELSGGQQQRVAIGRALVTRPTVLFADEPTGNLDSHTGEEILDLLRESVDDYGQTTVMVTHDSRAATAADRVLFLADGVVVNDFEPLNEFEVLVGDEGGDGAMIRTALKGMLARKLRTVLTGLAIVLGVGMVSAAYILTDTWQGAADKLSTAAYDKVDAVVTTRAAFDVTADSVGGERPPLPASVLADVRALPQVGVGGRRRVRSRCGSWAPTASRSAATAALRRSPRASTPARPGPRP